MRSTARNLSDAISVVSSCFGNHPKHLPATEWNDHAAADSGRGIAQVVKLTSVPYRNRYSNDSAQFFVPSFALKLTGFPSGVVANYLVLPCRLMIPMTRFGCELQIVSTNPFRLSGVCPMGALAQHSKSLAVRLNILSNSARNLTLWHLNTMDSPPLADSHTVRVPRPVFA